MGDYESALEHLKKFKGRDEILSTMAIGAIGDAYMELNDTQKALEHYLEAVYHKPNDFTSPIFLMKAGMTYELLGNYSKALEMYERIRDDYKKSFEYRSIDKYIARAKGIIENKK